MVDAVVDAEIPGARAAKGGLQAAENARHRHVEAGRALTVNGECHLRHVAAPGGEHAAQLRVLVGFRQHLTRHTLQLRRALPRLRLNAQVEAGGVAQPRQRRRCKGHDGGFRQGQQLALKGAHHLIQRRTLAPVFEHDGDKPAVRCAGAVEDVKPGDLNHVFHRRVFSDQLARGGHHRFGALQRGCLRQLDAGKEVALILLGQEALWHRHKADYHHRRRACGGQQRQPRTEVEHAHDPGVKRARGVQPAVEPTENGGGLCRTRAQQHRAERGRQGQRHEA